MRISPIKRKIIFGMDNKSARCMFTFYGGSEFTISAFAVPVINFGYNFKTVRY